MIVWDIWSKHDRNLPNEGQSDILDYKGINIKETDMKEEQNRFLARTALEEIRD